MNKENIYKTEGDGSNYQVSLIASVISKLTKESGTMLPKEPGVIKELLEQSVTVVAWSDGRDPKPIGFAAVTFSWGGWKEIGGLVVDKEYRQQGLGHSLVAEIIKAAQENYPDSNLFALCNEKSLKLFLDNGAKIITEPDMLPAEVFGECISCPMFSDTKAKGKLCCDIPVIIKSVV